MIKDFDGSVIETGERITRRVSNDGIERILGKKFPVLDDGFIRVVDYMGDDSSIAQAARVSYGAGTKQVHEDRGLIRYLMRHRHTTPFEMCEIKLHVRVPMDCWRQWIRHRMASVNEYSTRYSEAIDSMQKTPLGQWRAQSKSNKQGSSDALGAVDRWPSDFEVDDDQDIPYNSYGPHVGEYLTHRESDFHSMARRLYEERIRAGVAREQARKDLPLSTYTEAYWKIDLHNLLHFLSLRMDSHAQQEIREYANIIGNEIVAKWVPWTWEAFQDYRLNGMFLTSQEIAILGKRLKDESLDLAIQESDLKGRELEEFRNKWDRFEGVEL